MNVGRYQGFVWGAYFLLEEIVHFIVIFVVLPGLLICWFLGGYMVMSLWLPLPMPATNISDTIDTFCLIMCGIAVVCVFGFMAMADWLVSGDRREMARRHAPQRRRPF